MTAGQRDECDEIAKLVRGLYPDADVNVGYISNGPNRRYLIVGVWLSPDFGGTPIDLDGQMHVDYTEACAFWTARASAWHELAQMIEACLPDSPELDDDTYRADEDAWGEIED